MSHRKTNSMRQKRGNMKSINRNINITNIISILLMLVFNIIQDFIIYETPIHALFITYFVVGIINVIIAIINFVKREVKNGAMQLITGVIMIVGMWISVEEDSFMMFIFVSCIVIGLAIANLILTKNLEQKKKHKVILILFILMNLLQASCIIIPVVMNMINLKNLQNAINILQQSENIETYMYNKAGKTVFIDEKGNQIAENEYDISREAIVLKIDDKIIELRYVEGNDKLFVINSKGETIFELCTDFLGRMVEPEYISNRKVAENFFEYVTENQKFGIEPVYAFLGFDKYQADQKALYQYEADMHEYEEVEEDVEYIYFKNEEITNNILQVVVEKNQKEINTAFYNLYLESHGLESASNTYEAMSKVYDAIENFYQYKKQYYIIDTENHTKKQLECHNLLYEAYCDEQDKLQERILVYENGYLPYYDTEESGYFDENGEKNHISNQYLIQDITEKYIIVIDKNTAEIKVYDRQTNAITAEYQELKVYKNFYVTVTYDKGTEEYTIRNKNLDSIIQYKRIKSRNLWR